MKKANSNPLESFNGWLLGGVVLTIGGMAIVWLTPGIVGATMGHGGDGVGQFFVALGVAGAGMAVVFVSAVFLLLLSLLAWLA